MAALIEVRRPLAQMRKIAEQVAGRLAPVCTRIEIAGSIRRGKETVKDIELVAIPTLQADLFGNETPDLAPLNALLVGWIESGHVTLEKNGDRYKRFTMMTDSRVVAVDLFLATPDNYGYILMLRTGSAEFSRHMVTERHFGGLKPKHIQVSDGAVWIGAKPVAVPDEVTLFALWERDYIEPRERD